MDIANVFSILSQGKIISMNSKEYEEYAYFLANDNSFEEMDELVRKIGYNLIRENGYFFMSKKEQMDSKERPPNPWCSPHPARLPRSRKRAGRQPAGRWPPPVDGLRCGGSRFRCPSTPRSRAS